MAIPVTVIRHAGERLAKCSLTPLHGRGEITFLWAAGDFRFDATGFTVLAVNAPLLRAADASRPLLLPDSTWRLLPKILRRLDGSPVLRSLPAGAQTAYPRKSKIARDPDGGLASVEALYLAKKILGEDDPSLLENYHWHAQFLAANAALLAAVERENRR
jgi:pre-rRNA-processing protein TSR3